MSVYPYIVAAWVMCCGLFGIARSRNLVHLILCLSVVQSGTYVLLLAIGYRNGATAPIFHRCRNSPVVGSWASPISSSSCLARTR